MSTPTTARGALLRRAGTLLVAVALVGAPAASAFADPTTDAVATASATASASPSSTATGSPSPTVTGSPSPTATASSEPTPTKSPSPAAPLSPSISPTAPSTGTDAPADKLLKGASASLLAQAASSAVPQTAYAADFVARTLAAGDDHYVYPNSGGFFDGGNTIDAIIALAASGSGTAQMGESLSFLEANLGGYTGVDFGDHYVGGTSKTIIGVIATRSDPRSFGGTDLVAGLKGLEVASGRFSDTGSGDYTITITQALAIIALVRVGEPLSSASVDTLIAQQCSDGGFRPTIDDPRGCVSDPDVTGFAAQALVAAGSTSAANEALDWLAAAQGADGSIASAGGPANANTTGVAAQAFAAGGRDADLGQAQAFLISLQYGCTVPAALRGGLAFSASSRSTTTIADSDLRATPQGTLALSGGSLLSVTVSEGATSGTTTTACSTTPTSDPSSSVDPTSTDDATSGAGGSDPSETVDAAATGSLAQTGTDLALPALLGLLLVVVGGLAVWASSRRRGAHA